MGYSAVTINNRLSACEPVTITQGIKVLADTSVTALTTDESIVFRKGFFYAYASFASGVPTANAAAINFGKSATYLPDTLNPGEAILVEAPVGCRYRLADFRFKGTASDGIYWDLV